MNTFDFRLSRNFYPSIEVALASWYLSFDSFSGMLLDLQVLPSATLQT